VDLRRPGERGGCGITVVKVPTGRLEEVGGAREDDWGGRTVIVSGRGNENGIKVPAYGNENGVEGRGQGGGKRGGGNKKPRGSGGQGGIGGKVDWGGAEGEGDDEEEARQVVAAQEVVEVTPVVSVAVEVSVDVTPAEVVVSVVAEAPALGVVEGVV
jgi:hypothetical protein